MERRNVAVTNNVIPALFSEIEDVFIFSLRLLSAGDGDGPTTISAEIRSLPLQAGRKYRRERRASRSSFVLTGKADFCPANLAIAQTVLLVEAARTSRRNYINVISSLRRFRSSILLFSKIHTPFIPKSAQFIPNELPRISDCCPKWEASRIIR
jgi:hypothetical protein